MIEFDTIPPKHLAHVLGLVTTVVQPPPPDFDPAKASPDDLEAYWLPARPRLDAAPKLYAVWKEIVAEPFKFRIPTFPELPDDRHGRAMIRRSVRAEPRSKGLSAFIRGRLHDSRNWSGAYLTPRHPERFTLVAGKWTVPDPQIPAAVSIDSVNTGGDYRSSTWIGFGGKRPYNPLPQIGTSQYVQDGEGGVHKAFGAWWQWWIRDDQSHHYPIPILNFDVAAGDKMVALLFVRAPGEVQFFLKNRTSGVYVTFRVSVPGSPYPLGATAEWVHERPTRPRSEQMYPLPHQCTPIQFRNCLAASGEHAGEIARLYNLESARYVRMFEVFDAPFRSAFVSVPKRDCNANALFVY